LRFISNSPFVRKVLVLAIAEGMFSAGSKCDGASSSCWSPFLAMLPLAARAEQTAKETFTVSYDGG
jgi:hypothetical protein